MSDAEEQVPTYDAFYCITLFRELEIATIELLHGFKKDRITLLELYYHFWDLYVCLTFSSLFCESNALIPFY